MDIGVYQRRRARLAAAMQEGVAIIPTAPERTRNRDAHYPYRFDSYFYYLTGFREPGAALVIVAGAAPRSILFCRDKDPEREIWDGFRFGPDAARAAFGFDDAHPIA
ncbi:MAG: aminopeptidase P N-terminal domain-containing protein, partial [Burkholderiales bacterium]